MSDPRRALREAFTGVSEPEDAASLGEAALEAATEDMWQALKADNKKLFRTALDEIVEIKLSERG